MLDPNELYFTSENYKDLLDELGTEIEAEDIAEREGNYIDACDHGFIEERLNELLEEKNKLDDKTNG